MVFHETGNRFIPTSMYISLDFYAISLYIFPRLLYELFLSFNCYDVHNIAKL